MGHKYSGKKCRLLTMFVMTAFFFVVELLVGYFTNSMALVADSFHMLSDVLALIIAYFSVEMSKRSGLNIWEKNTFGWARAEVLGALINSVFLLALCFSIFLEAVKRLLNPEELRQPILILVVGVIGLIVNVIGLALFHEYGHGHSHGHSHNQNTKHSTINTLVATDDNENDERFTPASPPILNVSPHEEKKKPKASQMNMRGVFLHIASDALGSIIVIVSALVYYFTNWEYAIYIDPALSFALASLISYTTWPLLKDSALILLQNVPTHIQVAGIKQLIQEVEGVLTVHELHVWQLAGDRIIASAHIRCRNMKDYMVQAEKIKKRLHERGIHSTTIQPEFVDMEDEEDTSISVHSSEDCILDCPTADKDECAANTCCGANKQTESQTPSSCRQRVVSDAVPDYQPPAPSSSLPKCVAMEAGYIPVPTSSSVKHESSV